MTVQIEFYPTRKVMKRDKKIMNLAGFRPLHTDFIDNDESKGYRVTFVNGSDDPNSSEDVREDRLRFKLRKLLIKTIENNTIDWNDYKILLRLERGLKLQQSTIDKLIIVRQGGLSGIVQRIRNLFNL